MADIYKIFHDYIIDNHIIEENDHVIVGVSGGADSMCLLVLLQKLAAERNLRLTAVHVHHGLRGEEADGDETFVKEFCKERKIPCVAVHAPVQEYAKKQNVSLEEAGRIARYQTFYQVAKKIAGSNEIPNTIKAAVAHHGDDNAETVLMHMVRGTGLKGLRGMQPVSKHRDLTVVRPLLCLTRNDIEEYLVDEHVEYRTDSTNLEDEFTRNRFRHQIIPELEKINPKASEHINEAAGAIVEAQEFIEEEAAKAAVVMVDERDGGIYIDLSRFTALHNAVKGQVIRDMIYRLSGSLKDIGRVHIASVLSLQEKQTGRRIELPDGIWAQRSYSNLILRKGTADDRVAKDMTEYVRRKGQMPEDDVEQYIVRDDEPEAFAIDPARLSTEPVRYQLWKGMEVELELVHVNPVTRQFLIARNEYTKAFDCAKIKGNLIFRRPQPTDEIRFAGGSKTLRKFFVDEKVPAQERKKVVVLGDENQVMWIVGYRMSESYKLSELTNLALKVSIIGGKNESH